MTGLPAPWREHAALRAPARSSSRRRQRLALNEVTPRWDVDSLQIEAPLPEGLQSVELACGGVPLWTLTAAMLEKLPSAGARVELLREAMPYLPLSRILWQEVHLTATFDRTQLPAFTVYVRRCFTPTFSIPLRGDGAHGALFTVDSGLGWVNGVPGEHASAQAAGR